jgi:hypothetical protein
LPADSRTSATNSSFPEEALAPTIALIGLTVKRNENLRYEPANRNTRRQKNEIFFDRDGIPE